MSAEVKKDRAGDCLCRQQVGEIASAPVAQPDRNNGFLIQERVFAHVFAALRTVADARYFGHPAFATRSAELRSFAAKIFRAVENDRE
jgi:hypothetical protein